jgi:hypothetical protein
MTIAATLRQMATAMTMVNRAIHIHVAAHRFAEAGFEATFVAEAAFIMEATFLMEATLSHGSHVSLSKVKVNYILNGDHTNYSPNIRSIREKTSS